MIDALRVIYFLGLPLVAWYDARGKEGSVNIGAVLLWPLLVVGVCVMMCVDAARDRYFTKSIPELPVARAVTSARRR